jgi:phage shock protein C
MICPYCKTDNALGATRCAACTSWMVDRPPTREWTRARDGKLLAGICRGLSNRFGVPVAAVRLVFLLSILFGGWGVLAYVALWIAMPLEPAPAALLPAAPPSAQAPAPPPAG